MYSTLNFIVTGSLATSFWGGVETDGPLSAAVLASGAEGVYSLNLEMSSFSTVIAITYEQA